MVLITNRQSTGITEIPPSTERGTKASKGLVLSGSFGDTQFQISAGRAVFYDDYTDPDNPVETVLEFAGGAFPLPGLLTTSAIAYVGVRADGNLTYTLVAPNVNNLDGILWLGYVVSFDGGNTIRNAGASLVGLTPINVLALSLGMINASSTTISPIAGTLQADRPAMILYAPGRNWGDTPQQRQLPPVRSLPAQSPMTFNYMLSTGQVVAQGVDTFNLTQWDNNGTLTAVAGNNSSTQRIYSSSDGTIVVLYGQQEYGSINQGIQRYTAEQFTRPAELSGFILIGTLIARGDSTDISNENFARVIGGGKLGDGMGAGFTGNSLKPIGRGDDLPANGLDYDLFILDSSIVPANVDGLYYWDIAPGVWRLAVSRELEIKAPTGTVLEYDKINLVGDGGAFTFPVNPLDQPLEVVIQPGAANSLVSIGGTNYAVPEDDAGGTVPYKHVAFRFDATISPSGGWRPVQSSGGGGVAISTAERTAITMPGSTIETGVRSFSPADFANILGSTRQWFDSSTGAFDADTLLTTESATLVGFDNTAIVANMPLAHTTNMSGFVSASGASAHGMAFAFISEHGSALGLGVWYREIIGGAWGTWQRFTEDNWAETDNIVGTLAAPLGSRIILADDKDLGLSTLLPGPVEAIRIVPRTDWGGCNQPSSLTPGWTVQPLPTSGTQEILFLPNYTSQTWECKLASGAAEIATGSAVERRVDTANRNTIMAFGDLQFRVPSGSGLVSSLQYRYVGGGATAITAFTTKWSNQQGGASEQTVNYSLGTSWRYFRDNGLNLTQHNNYQNAEFICNGWLYHVQVIVGLSFLSNRFSFTRWRQEGVKGESGTDGTNGTDGLSVDHLSQTAGNSAPGTSNTYTLWGDAAETIDLGSYDVPIATPADFAQPLEDLVAEGNGSWTADETITLNGGKTWNGLLADGYEKVFISAKETAWRGKNVGGYFYLADLIRDGGAEIWTVASGNNRYEVTVSNVTGTGTGFTVINGGTGGHSDFKMYGVRPQKELLVLSPGDLPVTNPNETDTTKVLKPNGDGTAAFKASSIDYFQGHQVEFEVTGEFFDGKQVFGMGWDAPFNDTMLSSDFQLIPAGVVGYYLGMKGTVRTDRGYLVEKRNEDNGTGDTWRMGQTTPNGAFIIRQLTNSNRPFAAGTTYYNQKFTILYVKP